MKHPIVKAIAMMALLFAAFYCGAQKGYIDGYYDTAADMTDACNAAIASQEPEVVYYSNVYYEVPYLINMAMKQVDDDMPENGTNCQPRAILLNQLLQESGFNSSVEIGYLHCNRTGLSYGHAWVSLNLELWGSRAAYPEREDKNE